MCGGEKVGDSTPDYSHRKIICYDILDKCGVVGLTKRTTLMLLYKFVLITTLLKAARAILLSIATSYSHDL